MIDQTYFDLRMTYQQFGQKLTISISELAEFWSISTKQVKRRLRAYEEQKLLHYYPGQGRGHLTQIIFQSSFRDEVIMEMKQAIVTEDTITIFYLLKLSVPASWLASFRGNLTNFLGIQTYSENKRVLRQLATRPITTLDPVQVAIRREYQLVLQLGDTLVQFDEGLKAGLAHHWQSNNDATVWTFYLRKGVRFHNGKTMTAVDVKRTFERVRNEVGESYWQLVNLVDIILLADDIVQFKFSAPEPLFVRYVVDAKYVIVDCDVEFDEIHWVGTGAFQVTESTDTTLKLAAFDDYYGLRPMIDEVVYYLVDDWKVVSGLLNPADYGNHDYVKKKHTFPGAEFIISNLKRPTIIQQPFVRSALYHVIDTRVYDGIGGIPASHYDSRDSAVRRDKTLAQAQKKLNQANYQGEPIVLATLSHSKEAEELSKWIQRRAKKIGLNMEIIYYNFATDYYTEFLEKNADLVMLADIPMNLDEFAYIEFVSSPTLLVQRMLTPSLLEQLQYLIFLFKQTENEKDRHLIYLKIDNWLIKQNILFYTTHAVREIYVHQFLVNEGYQYDYKNAWKMPEINN
ncbi:ABC transporter substrate-binding protein [Leuconostoc mesenteroides]